MSLIAQEAAEVIPRQPFTSQAKPGQISTKKGIDTRTQLSGTTEAEANASESPRSIQDENWVQFIGECYVHGMTNGKVFSHKNKYAVSVLEQQFGFDNSIGPFWRSFTLVGRTVAQ